MIVCVCRFKSDPYILLTGREVRRLQIALGVAVVAGRMAKHRSFVQFNAESDTFRQAEVAVLLKGELALYDMLIPGAVPTFLDDECSLIVLNHTCSALTYRAQAV